MMQTDILLQDLLAAARQRRRLLVLALVFMSALFALTAAVLTRPQPAAAGQGVWTQMGLDGIPVNTVAVDPTNPNILFAGTDGQGIFRSSDGGRTWSQHNVGLGNLFINDILINPADPSIILVGAGRGALVGDPGGGVYRSTDRGATWTHHLSAFIADLDSAPQNSQVIYAAGAPQVFRSTNGGVDWEQAFSDPAIFQNVDMRSVSVSPADLNTVLVGGATEGGTGAVFRTTDGGQSWTLVHNTTIQFVTSVAFSSTDGQLAFFGNGQGVWRSRDAGVTWNPVADGLTVLDLLSNPFDGNILYVATRDQGVRRTANGGDSFHALNDGLGEVVVRGLAIDRAQPQTLWAGTDDGVWSFTIAEPEPDFQPIATWYFAEGSTAPPFDTWYLIQNPTANAARVRFTFQLEGGATAVQEFAVGAHSRFSVFANEILPNRALSVRIEANQPVFAERAMFVSFDGHVVTGVPQLSTQWLFAEGATTAPFHTWLLLQNPHAEPATATITYLLQEGGPQTQVVSLPPTSRTSIFVNEVLPEVAFSAQVQSDRPILAERAMYRFPGNAATGVAGVTQAARTWYFAEGHTAAQGLATDTWLLLQNPNPVLNTVTITLFREDGEAVTLVRTLPPSSRQSLFLNEFIEGSFGIRVEAGAEIIAERAMYFGNEPRGAHAAVGSPVLATTWNLPEGSTAPPFDEVIAILNPHGESATATVEFQLETGLTTTRTFTVPAQRKLSIQVDEIIPSAAVSARVTTSLPTVVERTMFIHKEGSVGAHNTIGIQVAS